jgi:hypothetical protein
MKKKGLIAAIVALALLAVATPAEADVIGGGGSYSGGGLSAGGNAPANWDRVVGIWDPTGAYDDFLSAAVGNGRYGNLNNAGRVEGHLRDLGILDQCRSSRLIIFLRDENYGVWMRYTSGFGITQEASSDYWTTSPGRGNVFIEERNAGGQPGWNDNWTTSAGTMSPKYEVQRYARGANPNTNVICAWGGAPGTGGNSSAPPANTTETSYTRNAAVVNDSATFTEPYSWATSVKREISANKDGALIDPIGADNLKDQPTVIKKTLFSGIYDSLDSYANESVQAKRDRIAAALANDKKADHSQLELTDNNKAGLAEGGVLSVYEQTKYATISASQSTPWQRCNQVTTERSWDGSKYVVKTAKSGPIPWNDAVCNSAPLVGGTPTFAPGDSGNGGFPSEGSGWRAGGTSYNSSKTLGTDENTGFWQVLSVHCNPTELAALLGTVDGEEIVAQTTGVDGNSTTVVNSQRYAARPKVVDFGVDRKDGTPKSRSGQLGFYDKECDLTCISTPTNGASTTNGATTNQSITTNQTGKDYFGGAILEGEANSNYFEIFRDNGDRKVDVNVAFPSPNDPQFKYGKTYPNAAGSGTVDIPAAAAVSTTITRWAEGTPFTTGQNGGKFSMEAVNSKGTQKLFSGKSEKPATQKNWTTNPYSTNNSTTLNGMYRTFVVKATWASEENLPQVLNVKWEYRPTVWTRFPSNVGFSSTEVNDSKISSYTVRDQAIDGKCYAQYGTTDRKMDLSTRVQESTGTGTNNTLDSGLVEAVNGDNSWQSMSNLVIKFLRAVSE